MAVTLGQQYSTGEKPTIMVYTYIDRHAGTHQTKAKQKHFEYIINWFIIIYSNKVYDPLSLATDSGYVFILYYPV